LKNSFSLTLYNN